MPADTIVHRLLSQRARRPSAPAYFVKQGGVWRPTSWRDYVVEIRTAARALMALGFPVGGKVAILGFNRPEWVIFDHAAMMAGGAAAGIYTTCSSEEVAYIVDHSEAHTVLVEDLGQWQKIATERSQLPRLRQVVTMRDCPPIDDPLVMSWTAFCERAAAITEAELDARIDGIEQAALATLIYTSGTTGPPKGVMLSHDNLAWTAQALIDVGGSRDGDCALSYLPLSHIAEQMSTILGPATSGATVYFAESIDKVPDNLREVQPTVVFGVPRIWEKFHAGVTAKLATATGVKARLMTWTQDVCRRVSALRNVGKEPGGALALQYRLVDRLVLSKLKPALGLGRARLCVTGAAPLAPDVIDFFASIDLPLYEIYGQSEDCGPTSFNLPGRTKFGTVGQPLPGVEVKLADDGEILVRGRNVFLGYYKEPEATRDAKDGDWLRSGDLGAFDADGFLTITGRKKEILITAGGKNISPKNIEAALKESPLIAEAVVIGDRRKFLSVLVTVDDAAVAAALGADPGPRNQRAALRDAIQRQVDAVNERLARVEQVKKFTILERPFAIETGELTPTLKIKRKIVNQNFATEIEAMYHE
ncbi:MAG: long-chain fatty acid--CoA ligase [Myxococcales bacterium]|nr:long-chain fatty acid--CoA ligase [Myxococcales bacterium]